MADDTRIQVLEAELSSLREELAELRRALRPSAASSAADPDQRTDRRHLLKALAAATGAAAVGSVVTARPAAANDGSTVLVGETNVQNTNDTTFLNFQPSTAPTGGNVLHVQSTAYTSTVTDSGSPLRAAVAGLADSGVTIGVLGYTESGTGAGVHGQALGAGVSLQGSGGRAQLRLVPQGAAPVARSDAHLTGELLVDLGQQLWVSVGAGTPGDWRRLAGPATVGTLELKSTPVRLYDSRPGRTPTDVTKGVLGPGTSRTIDLGHPVAAPGGLPPDTIAALLNVAVTNTSANGFIKVFALGAAVPGASSLNWFQSGSVVANAVTTRVDGSNRIVIRAEGGSTHVVVDVVGFYR